MTKRYHNTTKARLPASLTRKTYRDQFLPSNYSTGVMNNDLQLMHLHSSLFPQGQQKPLSNLLDMRLVIIMIVHEDEKRDLLRLLRLGLCCCICDILPLPNTIQCFWLFWDFNLTTASSLDRRWHHTCDTSTILFLLFWRCFVQILLIWNYGACLDVLERITKSQHLVVEDIGKQQTEHLCMVLTVWYSFDSGDDNCESKDPAHCLGSGSFFWTAPGQNRICSASEGNAHVKTLYKFYHHDLWCIGQEMQLYMVWKKAVSPAPARGPSLLTCRCVVPSCTKTRLSGWIQSVLDVVVIVLITMKYALELQLSSEIALV